MPCSTYLVGVVFFVLGWQQNVANASESVNVPASVKIMRRVHIPSPRDYPASTTSANPNGFVNRIFLDSNHQILVQVRCGQSLHTRSDKLYWVAKGELRQCTEWAYTPLGNQSAMELIAADLRLGLLYYITSSGIGNGAFLHTINRKGEDQTSAESPGQLLCLVNGEVPRRSYRGFNDWFHDVSEGGWIGIFQGNKLVKRVSVGEVPYRLFYIATNGKLILLRQQGWQTLYGKMHSYPHVSAPLALSVPLDARLEAGAVDIDASGKYLYYADRYGYRLYKIRLDDGVVAAVRQIPFVTSDIVIDSKSKVIYAVDLLKNDLVGLRQF